jgi:endonuclease YncB( thermonuclease family)
MLSLLVATAVAVLPSGKHFPCTPTHVWDGDGPIWCAEGPRVRLAGIAAREMDETCKSGHPCP